MPVSSPLSVSFTTGTPPALKVFTHSLYASVILRVSFSAPPGTRIARTTPLRP